jgi:hypothetical protein
MIMPLDEIFESVKRATGGESKKSENVYFMVHRNMVIKYIPNQEILIKLYLTGETIEVNEAKGEVEVFYYGRKMKVDETLTKVDDRVKKILEKMDKYEDGEKKLIGKLKLEEASELINSLVKILNEKNW